MATGTQTGDPDGLRARKQRQTRQRIAKAALGLFLDKGYDGTTIEAIAQAAEIAPRTFFHYFDSKEAIAQAFDDDLEAIFRQGFSGVDAALEPVAALRAALVATLLSYQPDEAAALDRLMQSTDALRARQQANQVRHEHSVFAMLRERWPEPARELHLRIVAMAGIGAMRIASELWRGQRDETPLVRRFENVYDELARTFGDAA